MKKCELLAPAGGMEALIAAVQAGADAVYLGGAAFSARQSAQNFEEPQLAQAIEYCHLRGVKVYAAVNTLVFEREFPQLLQYLTTLDCMGVDGLIVQDLGVAQVVRERFPHLPLHASTQMTVRDTAGVLMLQELGFSRVVLARELTKEAIKEICRNTTMEIEVFVHGAICVCYSGQCLMSSMIGGRSGNRGSCAQPCRLQYELNGTSGFLLSPKDMCLLPYVDELRDMGVASLKIEGRMKGPSYVNTVVGIYRSYLDRPRPVERQDMEALDRVFYRGGLTDGYYTGKTGRDMFCYTKPDNPYSKQTAHTPVPTQGCKRRVSFDCRIAVGQPATVTAVCDGVSAQAVGQAAAEVARNLPIAPQRVREQFAKLGGSVFVMDHCDVTIHGEASLPVSELNYLRRTVIEGLERAILEQYKRQPSQRAVAAQQIPTHSQPFSLVAQVSNRRQMTALQQAGCTRFYVPIHLAAEEAEAVVLPVVAPPDWGKSIDGKKVVASNWGQVYTLRQKGIPFITNASLPLCNDSGAMCLYQLGAAGATVATELMLAQIRGLAKPVPLEGIIYGRLTLMTTKNCIVKSVSGCQKGGVLTDRMGERFPLRCTPDCGSELLNSKPILMSDKMQELKASGLSVGRLVFTTETPDECVAVYRAYVQGRPLVMDFTRGKFYKGV